MVEQVFCKHPAGGSIPLASLCTRSSVRTMVVPMYKNLQEYIEARTAWLLREGVSPEQLKKMYWDGKQSVPEIAKSLGMNPQTLYELMRKNKILRRSRSESNFVTNKNKPQFQLRRELTLEQERLRIAGLMLYWAEGAKGRHSVDLANTDPQVILVFLRFLREICGVAESRLRVYLFIYERQEVEPIRQYWSRLTRIPVAQFQKPYVSKFQQGRTRRRVLENGVIHIRYNDKRLLQQILTWIQEEAGDLIRGAGTRVAKGVSL